MFIIVDKNLYKIIDSTVEQNIIDQNWIQTSQGSLIQLDMVNIYDIDNIPEDANYYYNGEFINYDPIEYQSKIDKYTNRVKELIKLKYVDSDTEIAILRKYTAGIDSKNEFADYNTYVEACKLKAKQEFDLI